MSTTGLLKVGLATVMYGPFEALGKDTKRCVDLAINEVNAAVGGRPIQLFMAGTLGDPAATGDKVLDLIKQDGVEIIIGPLSGNEGLRVKQIAHQHPDVVFLNGGSGAQELTLVNPAPNFFNFTMTGVQLLAGMGDYAYHELGIRTVAIIGEDYSYPYAQAGGFMIEFCGNGGRVVHKSWVPLGTSQFDAVIASIPDVDAILVLLAGSDAVAFMQAYEASGRQTTLLGGPLAADHNVLNNPSVDNAALEGLITCGINTDDNNSSEWRAFLDGYRALSGDKFFAPTYLATSYYINMRAGLLALQEVDGDISKMGDALSKLTLNGPSAPVKLDHNRQVITSNYITRINRDPQGNYYRQHVATIENVNQSLGMDEDEYRNLGTFDRDNPSCP